jgi:Peptidase A4 family
MRSSLKCTLAATVILAAIPITTATAAGPSQAALSSNWAGYVVNSPSDADGFRSVSGSWTQPSVDCSTGDGESSLWVGLGGQSEEITGLEQTGTAANCTDGQASYYAWYELIPQAPVTLDMAITPGDRMSATVTVNGTAVRIQLADHSTGRTFDRTLRTDDIDVSSAEWIAEAPSTCDASGCTPVPLADFGTAGFTDAAATTTGGHGGSISDSDWQAVPMALAGSEPGAQASSLTSGGSAFSVSTTQASSGGYGDDPYGSGYGYGSGSGSGDDSYGYDPGYSDPYGSDPGYGDPYGSDPYGWDGGYWGG